MKLLPDRSDTRCLSIIDAQALFAKLWKTYGLDVVINDSSRMSADDRLSLDPFGRVEGSYGIVEGGHLADVCSQPAVPSSLHDLAQLAAIGYDDEINGQAV